MNKNFKNKIFKIGMPVPAYGPMTDFNMDEIHNDNRFPFPVDCRGMKVKREAQWNGFDTSVVTDYDINRENFSYRFNVPQSVTTFDMGDYTKVVDKSQRNYKHHQLLPDGTQKTIMKTHIRTNTVNMPHDLTQLAKGEGDNPKNWGNQTIVDELYSTVETAKGNTVIRLVTKSRNTTVNGNTYKTGWTLLEKKDVTGVTYYHYKNGIYEKVADDIETRDKETDKKKKNKIKWLDNLIRGVLVVLERVFSVLLFRGRN
ncbi:MAG: hypothetical protein GY765_42505 [bacterium]|nr:hypothetical protein [bacterium]